MHKPLLLTLFFIATVKMTAAQNGNPFPYKFSANIYEEIKADSNRWKGGVTSSDLSFIGMYREALIEWDKARPFVRTISAKDSLDFIKKYRPENAKAFIQRIAKTSQIIIINEAHYNPRHRVFVTAMLEDLKKLGYSYLLAETFTNKGAFGNNYNPPTLNLGYYTMEPQFGNMVREANRLNYTLYPYEDTTRSNGKNREISQAKNIAALLVKDPGAKMIIYCGFSHILEDTIVGWEKAMAGRVKEYTGIDPFTIDQVVLSESSLTKFDNPYYRIIKSTDYAVLVDKNEQPFNKRLDGQYVDALLYAPPTNYVHGRPGWVFENGKTPVFLREDSIKVSFPLLVKAYFLEEEIEKMVVPFDIVEMQRKEDLRKIALAAFAGKDFVVQLIDTAGKTQLIRVSSK